MILLKNFAIIATQVGFSKSAEFLADSIRCPETAEQGILGQIPSPQIKQNQPTLAGYMPKELTNIKTKIYAKPLYVKTSEAARLLENNMLTPSDRKLGNSISRNIIKCPADQSRDVHNCGKTKPIRYHETVFNNAQPINSIEFETFGQPSEDDGVRILESDAHCLICLDTFLEPRKNPEGQLEWHLIHSCPKCMVCFHRKCLKCWVSTNNKCPRCYKQFSLISAEVAQSIDASSRRFTARAAIFISVVFVFVHFFGQETQAQWAKE